MYDVLCDLLSPHSLICYVDIVFITGILDDLICEYFFMKYEMQYIFSFSLFILIDTVHYAIFGFHFHVESFLNIE